MLELPTLLLTYWSWINIITELNWWDQFQTLWGLNIAFARRERWNWNNDKLNLKGILWFSSRCFYLTVINFQSLLMFVTVFYVVVFISGLLGNLSVIAVVVRSKGLHSAMNYYLISLAIADILIIILGELYQVLALYIFLQHFVIITDGNTTVHNAMQCIDIVCWYNNVLCVIHTGISNSIK